MDRLRAMELFLSISQTRNFSETARRFGISATGVSRMITEIEEDLKVKLLLRSTRQVALTESGQEYARQLESILWRIKELQTNITAISAAPQGSLRVHSRVMFGLGVLPPLASALLGLLALGGGLAAFLPASIASAPVLGLSVLSLPLLASLQFYAGYPLRVITAEASRWLAVRVSEVVAVVE